MGASLITDSAYGMTMKDAYKSAVEEAISEYGHDSYNGTISTTQGCTDVTAEFKKLGKSLGDFADYLYDNNRLNKWGDALGICSVEPKPNLNKVKTQVKTTPQKGKRVWESSYEVRLFDGTVIGSSPFQADAIDIGRKYTEKYQYNTYVHITKKLVRQPTEVSIISYKKSDKERLGYFYFIALAAE